MNNNGKKYEKFVSNLQQALLDSEKCIKQKNIKIELNKKIIDNFGIEREFDLYWEYEIGGLSYKTVIECKDYKSKITIEKIDALIGKIRDTPDLKAVVATKIGYQKGAITKAKKNKIDLLIVREQNNSDWEDKDGNPYIKEINAKLPLLFPAKIIKFIPIVDVNWLKENTDIDTNNNSFRYSTRNDKIIIENLDKNEKYSLFELSNKLTPSNYKNYGHFEKEEKFKNAYIYFDDKKLKLNSYKIEYIINKPAELNFHIDYSSELLGVIEYLLKGVKKSIFKNEIREEKS